MRGKKSGAQVDVCAQNEPSEWQKRRMTRRLRLAIQQLSAAAMTRFEDEPTRAKWFCMAVFGGRELTLEQNLKDAGVDVFVPRERWTAVKKGVKVEGESALLPGYMLVRVLPSAEAFFGLKLQEGVVDFVGGSTGYYEVRLADVTKLKAICDTNDISRMAVDRSIGQGSKVQITHGPFAGHDCVVVQVTAARNARATVWIEAFGDRLKPVTLPLAFLKKV
jgi:transcriptional antiterminator NusG